MVVALYIACGVSTRIEDDAHDIFNDTSDVIVQEFKFKIISIFQFGISVNFSNPGKGTLIVFLPIRVMCVVNEESLDGSYYKTVQPRWSSEHLLLIVKDVG